MSPLNPGAFSTEEMLFQLLVYFSFSLWKQESCLFCWVEFPGWGGFVIASRFLSQVFIYHVEITTLCQHLHDAVLHLFLLKSLPCCTRGYSVVILLLHFKAESKRSCPLLVNGFYSDFCFDCRESDQGCCPFLSPAFN